MFTRADQYSLSSFDMVKNYLHGVDLFPIVQPLFHRSHVKILPLLYYYFHGKCSVELHSLIPSDHTFTSRTRYANSTESNFLLIQEKSSTQAAFSQVLLLCETDSCMRLPRTMASSSFDLIIFPPYFYNLNFLPPSLPLISQTSLCITIFTVIVYRE